MNDILCDDAPILFKEPFASFEDCKKYINNIFHDEEIMKYINVFEIAFVICQSIYMESISDIKLDPKDLLYTAVHKASRILLSWDDESEEFKANVNQLYLITMPPEPASDQDFNENDDEFAMYTPVPRGESKLATARNIYHNNKHLSRKEIIRLFIDKIGMREKSAATYYYLVKEF